MNWDSESVTRPSAKTPAVCVTVTVAPSAKAWRAVPRVPARYAATMALPCPGVSACAMPKTMASPSAMATPTVPRRSPSISEAKRSSPRPASPEATLPCVRTPSTARPPEPRRASTVAAIWSGGLCSRSCG